MFGFVWVFFDGGTAVAGTTAFAFLVKGVLTLVGSFLVIVFKLCWSTRLLKLHLANMLNI